jgi:methylglutaconyl-CoA hydratase
MLVNCTRHDSAAILTMNRPEKRNALSRALIEELRTAFRIAQDDGSIRSIVLTGNGPAFCAGMDLEELRETINTTQETVWEDAHRLSSLYEQIYNCPKPTIAAINGTAVAGGAGLMTVCDLAVAVPGAMIGYPEVRRGLVAAMVMPHLLRLVGERTARWLLLTGELLDSIDALKLGLVNHVANAEMLMPMVARLCNSLEQGGPKALATTKQLLRSCSQQSVGIEQLAKASAEPRLTDECQTGLRAFFQKEAPPWVTTSPAG